MTRLDAAEQCFTRRGRFDRAPRNDLLELIETVTGLLGEAREATASGPVSIAARAEYLRAQAAHRRALATWSWADDEHQIDVVRDALEHARSTLDARVRRSLVRFVAPADAEEVRGRDAGDRARDSLQR